MKNLPRTSSKAGKQNLFQKKTDFQGLLKDTDKRVENWLEIAERGFNFAEKASAIFAEARENDDPEARKEIFAALGSNLFLKMKEIEY